MTFEIDKKTPFLITVICDFNAKSENWYNKDKTSFPGKTKPVNQWTYVYIAEFLLAYFQVSVKFGNQIRRSFFPSFKLSSSDCFCKI